MTETASARPTKRFFIDMLTADISFEDAVLDLVDNSVDAVVQLSNAPLDSRLIEPSVPEVKAGRIDITISPNEVSVVDDGVGIQYEDAVHSVFRLGRVIPMKGNTLGVYGIGMKRALFKIGNAFDVRSKYDDESGFYVSLENVEHWAENDPDNPEPGDDPWALPIVHLNEGDELHGTAITITKLRPEIARRLEDPTVLTKLRDQIGRTYSLILEKYVSIYLNGALVEAIEIPIGSSEELQRAVQHLEVFDGNVKATIVVGLVDSEKKNQEVAGWYVLCNGRAVVWADKTSMTGWGDGLPQFVASFRYFVGIVFFFSAHPQMLPWQTTKRGLNLDSRAYLETKSEMQILARPVIAYLRSLYSQPADETQEERQQLESVAHVPMSSFGSAPSRTFQVAPIKKVQKDSVKVQYSATWDEIRRAGEIMGEPTDNASRVGRGALEYVLEEND